MAQNDTRKELFFKIALSYSNEGNSLKAKEYFEKSGTPDALCGLGTLYYFGKLGKPDYNKAKEYFEKSGTPNALFGLGGIYHYGYGELGKPDYNKAIKYYKKSGIPDALYQLGNIYHFQDNLQEAKECFEKCLGICNMPDLVGQCKSALCNIYNKLIKINDENNIRLKRKKDSLNLNFGSNTKKMKV